MPGWQLAQLNIAHLSAPIDSPELADFVANLDRINALAEQSPGFIWRLQDDVGNATGIEQPFGEDLIVNMSVWESVEALHNYVYRSAHSQIMSRRKEWFQRMKAVYTVLWWVPTGHQPDVMEAHRKLLLLESNGPGPDAFTFKTVQEKPVSDL